MKKKAASRQRNQAQSMWSIWKKRRKVQRAASDNERARRRRKIHHPIFTFVPLPVARVVVIYIYMYFRNESHRRRWLQLGHAAAAKNLCQSPTTPLAHPEIRANLFRTRKNEDAPLSADTSPGGGFDKFWKSFLLFFSLRGKGADRPRGNGLARP